MVLSNFANVQAKKVDFPHKLHVDKSLSCVKCHHAAPGDASGAANPEKNCHQCHSPSGKGEASLRSKDAFHQTCRACHEAMGKGPTKCDQCHKPK